MSVDLKKGNVDGLLVHFLEFLDNRTILQTSIAGTLVNSITEDKNGLLRWKQKIANIVHSKRECKHDPKWLFAVSLWSAILSASSRKSIV